MKLSRIGAIGVFITCGAFASAQVINEFVFNHTGSDTDEFVEMYGVANPGGYWAIVVEGDSGVISGRVDYMFQFDDGISSGLFHSTLLASESGFAMENGSQTLFLANNLGSVTIGDDLDLDDNGVLDSTPWTTHDSVSVTDGGAGDLLYSSVVLDSSLAPNGSTVGGASRKIDGVNTGNASDWWRNDPDGDGLPSFGNTGTAVLPEALNTRLAPNAQPVPEPASMIALGLGVAALIRRKKKA